MYKKGQDGYSLVMRVGILEVDSMHKRPSAITLISSKDRLKNITGLIPCSNLLECK